MSNPSKPSGTKAAAAASPLALDDLKALAGFLAESGLEEIELELSPAQGGGRVRLKRPGSAQATTTVITPAAPATATAAVTAVPAAEPTANAFTSPMVGTFYQAASPEAPAFVKVGDTVKAGQVLCIIEAMKTMNQIESDRAGTVQKIIATNGTPVEFGQPLFIIS